MNKQDLINKMAEDADISNAAAGKALDAFTDAVTDILGKGEKVELVGFGSFQVVARAARAGRNPRTGETIQIKAANVPKFKPGKKLKDAVNQGN